MEPNLPATHAATPATHAATPATTPAGARGEHGLVLDTTHDLHGDHVDPQQQVVQSSVRVAILPLAIVALLVITFVAAAWTFLAALPHA